MAKFRFNPEKLSYGESEWKLFIFESKFLRGTTCILNEIHAFWFFFSQTVIYHDLYIGEQKFQKDIYRLSLRHFLDLILRQPQKSANKLWLVSLLQFWLQTAFSFIDWEWFQLLLFSVVFYCQVASTYILCIDADCWCYRQIWMGNCRAETGPFICIHALAKFLHNLINVLYLTQDTPFSSLFLLLNICCKSLGLDVQGLVLSIIIDSSLIQCYQCYLNNHITHSY